MPFADGDVRTGLHCGKDPDGHWHGWRPVKIRGAALRRLGLHPDQGRQI